jgi:hypothetical protein
MSNAMCGGQKLLRETAVPLAARDAERRESGSQKLRYVLLRISSMVFNAKRNLIWRAILASKSSLF